MHDLQQLGSAGGRQREEPENVEARASHRQHGTDVRLLRQEDDEFGLDAEQQFTTKVRAADLSKAHRVNGKTSWVQRQQITETLSYSATSRDTTTRAPGRWPTARHELRVHPAVGLWSTGHPWWPCAAGCRGSPPPDRWTRVCRRPPPAEHKHKRRLRGSGGPGFTVEARAPYRCGASDTVPVKTYCDRAT